jgi:hypothetical protein
VVGSLLSNMEKNLESKDNSIGTDSNPPINPDYGESEPAKASLPRRVIDSFKRDPNAHVTKAGQVGADGQVFDVEEAAANTANSPLHRRLKSRHLQMIAIGGSIGMHSTNLDLSSRASRGRRDDPSHAKHIQQVRVFSSPLEPF